MMTDTQRAQSGNTVRFHYVGRLDDGQVFGTTENRDPLELRLGEGSMIPGVEGALVGMAPGESKSVQLPVEQAYGPHREDLVAEFQKEQLPAEIEPEVGQRVQLRTQDGDAFPAEIVDVNEQAVKLDANHPLAGKSLKFDLELVEIVD
jgi:peptidylprolyl isomerase